MLHIGRKELRHLYLRHVCLIIFVEVEEAVEVLIPRDVNVHVTRPFPSLSGIMPVAVVLHITALTLTPSYTGRGAPTVSLSLGRVLTTRDIPPHRLTSVVDETQEGVLVSRDLMDAAEHAHNMVLFFYSVIVRLRRRLYRGRLIGDAGIGSRAIIESVRVILGIDSRPRCRQAISFTVVSECLLIRDRIRNLLQELTNVIDQDEAIGLGGRHLARYQRLHADI
jgi:hypothetical protein